MTTPLMTALKAALPYVQRVADTAPTEMMRQQRQREAVALARSIRAIIAEVEDAT